MVVWVRSAQSYWKWDLWMSQIHIRLPLLAYESNYVPIFTVSDFISKTAQLKTVCKDDGSYVT